MNKQLNKQTMLLTAFLVFGGMMQLVNAHFTIQTPVDSREKQFEPGLCYWPISGAAAFETRPKFDCLMYQRGKVATLSAGQSVKIGYDIAEGADHPGPCTAQLIDLTSGEVTSLGTQVDCISKDAGMTVSLPSKTCTNCVVKIKVEATHLAPTTTEVYDSCMDVSIGGGTSGGTPSSTATPSLPSASPTALPTSVPSGGGSGSNGSGGSVPDNGGGSSGSDGDDSGSDNGDAGDSDNSDDESATSSSKSKNTGKTSTKSGSSSNSQSGKSGTHAGSHRRRRHRRN